MSVKKCQTHVSHGLLNNKTVLDLIQITEYYAWSEFTRQNAITSDFSKEFKLNIFEIVKCGSISWITASLFAKKLRVSLQQFRIKCLFEDCILRLYPSLSLCSKSKIISSSLRNLGKKREIQPSNQPFNEHKKCLAKKWLWNGFFPSCQSE